MRVVLLTGQPGVGKTTMIDQMASHYTKLGLSVHGIITREVRENGQRLGFKITDFATKREGWLARKDLPTGPKIGSYRVVSDELEKVGVSGLLEAINTPSDLILIDEIGPMEMTSNSFRNAVARILHADKPTVATVKLGSHYEEIEQVRSETIQIQITPDNREQISHKLIEQIDEWIGLENLGN